MEEGPLSRIVTFSLIGGLALFLGVLLLLYGFGGCCGGQGLLTTNSGPCSCAAITPSGPALSIPFILAGAGLLAGATWTGLQVRRENQ